jgi:hypothetical protein
MSLGNKILSYGAVRLGQKSVKPAVMLGNKSIAVIKNVAQQQLDYMKSHQPVSDLEKNY